MFEDQTDRNPRPIDSTAQALADWARATPGTPEAEVARAVALATAEKKLVDAIGRAAKQRSSGALVPHTEQWRALATRHLAAVLAGDPVAWRQFSLAEAQAIVQAHGYAIESDSMPLAQRDYSRQPTTPVSRHATLTLGPFRRVAAAWRSLYEEGDRSAHTRIAEVLVRDHYVLYGTSLGGGTYREHAVPLQYLRNRVFEMFVTGMSDDEVAAFLQTHLKIVHISRDEAERINNLGLRTTMPHGWRPGDDVFARFAAAGIQIRPYREP